MIHSLQGGGTCYRGFTAVGTTIGTRESSANDADYVKEHPPLKYLRKKIPLFARLSSQSVCQLWAPSIERKPQTAVWK